MVETDWREILSFSQRELAQADKEKLCESLSWMEADDIELNFSDLKTLFRLAQDILKFKSEQVNSLLGQLETAQRKSGKGKSKSTYMESPTKSSDSVLETITHQEEVIKANKEILEQLYADIAELEGRKHKLEDDRNNFDRDSESSRDTLSEMNAVAELENEVSLKNKHIRKLLGDVKILEEENTKLKEKVSVLKDKLTEATGLIENLTEQLFSITNENSRLKEAIGKSEQTKAELTIEIENLRKEIFEKQSTRENIYEEVKSKVQHWKNVAKAKKAEIEALYNENTRLKEGLIHASQSLPSSPKATKRNEAEVKKIQELQEKLSEAANEIIESAKIIDMLKAENKQLKVVLEDTPDFSVSDTKNESDDGKERSLIIKLKKKVKSLSLALKGSEEMVALREKELAEITSQLQQVSSDEGINAMIERLNSNKRKLKLKDDGIKSLVQEINSLSQMVDELQLENETMRRKFNIPADEKIPTKGVLKNLREQEQNNAHLAKKIRKLENKLVNLELDNHNLNNSVKKLSEQLREMGCSEDIIDMLCKAVDTDDDVMPRDGGGEASTVLVKRNHQKNLNNINNKEEEFKNLIEENEGLRRGLQEILNFLKDNSSTSSGVLALQCPSLEAVLNSLEARHAAGWFAPHMAAVMELKSALGGKDALLSALHEARRETFDVMTKLSKETEKSRDLAQRLHDIEVKNIATTELTPNDLWTKNSIGEFGTWMSEKEQIIDDFSDKNKIEEIITKGNLIYEDQLKSGLIYFHNKFKSLFEKMTSIAVQTTDSENKWLIQEEKYKAEIANLRAEISQNNEEETSDMSPGLLSIPSTDFIQRKCSYLEESYKYIRTLNENMKIEYLEAKRDAMVAAADYETDIQKLMISVANLTDKLRSSIPLELFWKQNEILNDTNIKYRKLMEISVDQKSEYFELSKRLENDKAEILSNFRQFNLHETKEDKLKSVMANIEQTIYAKQLEQVCTELNEKNKQVEKLQDKITELQQSQSKLIDETLASTTKEEDILMKDQLERLAGENNILKEQCQHIESQLDIALLQLQDNQQRQMSNDMEVNLLRHQILDLQSVGDNKAIIARLSGEVLVAHLQATESHKKIERLNASLNKEKQLRIEAEEMLKARQRIFDVYAFRYEAKFRYMYEIMQTLRQQYQGSLPIISLEDHLNIVEELTRKTHEVNEKLDEIEDLQSNLMIKHSIFDQILDVSKNKCLEEEDSCQHKLQNIVLKGTYSRELEHCKIKLKTLEQSREDILKRCNYFEKTLVLVNQGFEKPLDDIFKERRNSLIKDNETKLEVEDVQSEDESDSRASRTITLPKPLVLKPTKSTVDMTKLGKNESADILMGSPVKATNIPKAPEVVNVFVQTSIHESTKLNRLTQTDKDDVFEDLKDSMKRLEITVTQKNKELNEAMMLARQRTEEILSLNAEKIQLETKVQTLNQSVYQKERLNENLHTALDDLRKQIDDYKNTQITERVKTREASNQENKAVVAAIKKFEIDKNSIVGDYTELLKKEREQYASSVKKLQVQIMELQTQLDKNHSETSSIHAKTLKEAISKYTVKISDLEDKCFKLQSELDGCKSELTMYQGEVDRWKDLATERLTKMELLNTQLEERHSHEVESYKAENEHWLSQLNDTQREHMELRSRLTEQKALYVKQLADKDAHIEQLRSVVHGLKTQIMNMQTMISITDPSFDLSAIVEVEEVSDGLSQPGSDRLELKYDSSIDLPDGHDDLRTSSSTIWQEPVIERLRREKQLTGKQNAMLRRQIKALAARERRTRLDAQNLKNQVFRISTSGGSNKVTTAETAALHNKIASLQAQLMSARRDTHSTVALWDKWKRAQQAAERWQMRFEEKCQEIKKLESSVSLAKSAVNRLEKEKRVLLSRLAEAKTEKVLVVEKHDSERSEKRRALEDCLYSTSEPPVSARALLDRVQAQQRRITALEVAEKGNEHLVSEYEKSLAEITSLKGQVLKLESTLLESQIRSPMKSNQEEQHTELEYWKSYCDMLKEENVQMNLKLNAMETTPTTAHQHRVNDLEQTVLTLRGLVSKLQAEQKSSGAIRRPDSRPSSGRSGADKVQSRTQLESYRIEIANLKRSIQDKDLLLERSKEMLKIAAEREDDLLRENALLRHQINELTRPKHGFLSA